MVFCCFVFRPATLMEVASRAWRSMHGVQLLCVEVLRLQSFCLPIFFGMSSLRLANVWLHCVSNKFVEFPFRNALVAKKSQLKKGHSNHGTVGYYGTWSFFGIISFSIHWLIFFKRSCYDAFLFMFLFEERIPSEKSTVLKKRFKSSTQKCGNGMYRLNFEDDKMFILTC